jgi:ComF family protein
MLFEYIKNFLLDLAFPKRCLSCGIEGSFVCYDCLGKINFLQNQQCPKCRRPNMTGEFCGPRCKDGFYFDRMIVCCEYRKNSLIQKLISTFKYRFVSGCDVFLAEILRTQFFYLSQFTEFLNQSVFIPVPIHKKRLLYRGFNQSRVLSEKLLKILKNDPEFENHFENLEFSDCLFRRQYSHEQATLKRNERLNNLVSTISLDEKFSEKIKNKSCIVIDDVATTCSTLNECSKILKLGGARYVCGLVLARGI